MRFSRKLALLVAIPAVLAGAALAAGTLVSADTQPPPRSAKPGLAPKLAHPWAHGLLAAVAEATHLTEAQLRAELAAGQKLPDIITANGATLDQVAEILLKQAAAKLAAQVKAGKLTQAQADELTAKLKEGVLHALSATPPTSKLAPPADRKPPAVEKRPKLDRAPAAVPHKDALGGILAAVAQATHLTEAQLRAELAAGQKLPDIITANGATLDQVVGILLQQATDKLAAQVEAGKLTQAQADEIAAKLKGGFLHALSATPPTSKLGPPADRKPPAVEKRPKLAPPAVIPQKDALGGFIADTAKLLALTPAEIMQELRAGKSLTEVLAAHGKSAADLKAAIVATAKTRFDAAVAAGKLTQAQADAALARLSESVDRALSNPPPPFGKPPHPAPGTTSQ